MGYELRILLRHPIYIICMVVLPLFVTVYFTSLMNDGLPVKMPIAVVDQDNTSTTRKLTRMIDGFQSSKVVAHYPTADEARTAIQRGEIYGFMLFPKGMTAQLISMRQPKMSIYYSNTTLAAGSLLYKEMKTLCTLASAAVGQQTMQAKGYSSGQTMALLQPIAVDTHTIGNPWVSYNIYLSTMLIPASLLLFVFLMTAYSLGTEIKFGTQHEWLRMHDGKMLWAMMAKLLPQTVIFLVVMYFCMAYMFGVLHFPAPGGKLMLLILGLLSILAAQGFAVFIFGLIPSLRMSMSICSLWSVLSYSMVGTAFPVFAMDAPLQTLSWLFPMRHYYIIYQLCVFNTYPLTDVWPHVLALIIFAMLPIFVARRIKKTFLTYGYVA